MENNLEDKIRENAAGPKSAEIDGQKVEQHPLAEQIAADEYLARRNAMRMRNCGLKITKLTPPGGV